MKDAKRGFIPSDENWEHRSYKEQGLDILGEKLNAKR